MSSEIFRPGEIKGGGTESHAGRPPIGAEVVRARAAKPLFARHGQVGGSFEGRGNVGVREVVAFEQDSLIGDFRQGIGETIPEI